MSVQSVVSEKIRGADVMVGEHEDGSYEVRLWETQPVNPRTAAEEVDRSLVQWGLYG